MKRLKLFLAIHVIIAITLSIFLISSAASAYDGELAVDFGTTGLYLYDGSSWTALSGSDPGPMEAWGSYLAAYFGTTGLYLYNGSSWDKVMTTGSAGSLLIALYISRIIDF